MSTSRISALLLVPAGLITANSIIPCAKKNLISVKLKKKTVCQADLIAKPEHFLLFTGRMMDPLNAVMQP